MTDFVYATHSGLYFARVDLSQKKLMHSFLIEDGYHYGLSVNYDSVKNTTLICSYRGGKDVHHQDEMEIRTYVLRDVNIESAGNWKLDDSVGHVHQLAHAPRKGELYLSNTKYNSIDIWVPSCGIASRYCFDGHKSDVNHVNSVCVCGDHLAVMLHNLRRQESQISICRNVDTQIVEIARKSIPDLQCHNIGILGDKLFYNASGASSIVGLDVNTLRVSARLRVREHTKGLCSDGVSLFAGMSNYATRNARATSSAWLLQVDPAKLTALSIIPLTDPIRQEKVGNINEIRIVNREDVFESGSACNPDALSKMAGIKQNYSQIMLRRCWFRTTTGLRRTYKQLSARGVK